MSSFPIPVLEMITNKIKCVNILGVGILLNVHSLELMVFPQ